MRRGQLLVGRAAPSPDFEGSNVRARAGRGWPRRFSPPFPSARPAPRAARSPEGDPRGCCRPTPGGAAGPRDDTGRPSPAPRPRSLPLLAAAGPVPTPEAPRRGRGGSRSRSFVCLPQRHTPRRLVGPGSCVREYRRPPGNLHGAQPGLRGASGRPAVPRSPQLRLSPRARPGPPPPAARLPPALPASLRAPQRGRRSPLTGSCSACSRRGWKR